MKRMTTICVRALGIISVGGDSIGAEPQLVDQILSKDGLSRSELITLSVGGLIGLGVGFVGYQIFRGSSEFKAGSAALASLACGAIGAVGGLVFLKRASHSDRFTPYTDQG
jgi:hypothetical protein